MKKPYDPSPGYRDLREKIIGLGERSIRKSYYPELQHQVAELERFRALLDQSRDVILLVEIPSWRLVDVNESGCSQLGRTRRELLGMSLMDLIPLDAWEQINSLFPDQLTLGGEGLTVVSSLKRHGGEGIRVEMTVRPVAFSDAIYTVIVARDISEREAAEEALRESEEKLRAVIYGSPVPQYFVSRDHTVLYWNKALEDYTGIKADVMVGTTNHWSPFYAEKRPCLADLLAEGDEAGLSDWYGGKYSKSKSVENAYEVIDFFPGLGKAGMWLHLTAVAVRDSRGRIIGALETAVDITEQKLSEEALHASEEKFRGIFENAIEGIFQSTVEGRYLSVNPAYARMHGFESPEEMISAITDIGTQVFVHPEDRHRLLAVLGEKGFIIDFETEQFCKDKTRIWVSANIRAVRDEAGEMVSYEGTAENVTERRQLESRLLQVQKMESIGTLAGGIAHDFNNILTVLLGYATLMQTTLDTDSPLQECVEHILASIQKGTNLTRSLLAFSRKQATTLRPVSVNRVISEIEKILRRLITEDITLKTDLAPYNIAVMADPTQIDQVLINLAVNARDAMPRGGTLTIATGSVEPDSEFAARHGLEEGGRYACISVSDTGTGMEERIKEQIFDPFFTTKEPGKGTGLGLSTVYGIVKQHKGQIVVYSALNKGTSFQIYLPMVTGAAEEAVPECRRMEEGNEMILLADDDQDVRRTMKGILTRYGYRVIEAADGEEALKVFTETPGVELLVLDMVMPKKNGREVYEEIRKIDPAVKVLFVSGYARDTILGKGLADNEFDFVTKPVAPLSLLAKVRAMLKRGRLAV